MQRRRLILRTLVVSLLLYSLLSFGTALVKINKLRSLKLEAEQQLTVLKGENYALRKKFESPVSDEEIIALAREKLGLTLPGEITFIFTKDREEPSWGLN